MRGLITKGIGGFYYVQTAQDLIEAKGRGIFKKDGITLMVGDEVEIQIIDEEEKTSLSDHRLQMWIFSQSCLHRRSRDRISL